MTVLLIAVAGGLGAALRFLADGAIQSRWHPTLPAPTMGINTMGSLLLGVLTGLLAAGQITPNALTVLGIGLCGGFTTFSTAMVQSAWLLRSGDWLRGLGNLVGTLVLTVSAAAVGYGAAWMLT